MEEGSSTVCIVSLALLGVTQREGISSSPNDREGDGSFSLITGYTIRTEILSDGGKLIGSKDSVGKLEN